jgi:glycosyltransferase 2 family protein
MKKSWLTWFVYISMAFLVYTLIRNDYLELPDTLNIIYLVVSLVLLIAATIAEGLAYKVVLRQYGYEISARDSLIAFGITIFSRYIPGKFWIHLGRAEYIRSRYGFRFGEMTYISLYSQFLGTWSVIFLCSAGLLLLDIDLYVKIIALIIWLLLTIIIFTPYFQKLVQKIARKGLKKELSIPFLGWRNNFRAFPIFVLFWVLYAIAFYVLALSVDLWLGIHAIIYFPISTIIGIAAVFAPGGLGLREASLVGLLALDDVDAVLAASLAAFSRLWFLAGELFVFLLAIGMKFFNRHRYIKNFEVVIEKTKLD